MPGFKLAIIVGSLRKESFNLRLAKAIAKLGEGKFEASFPYIGDFPLYNQDMETGDFPAAVMRAKGEIEKADAVLFVTPEYNRSLPGVLKNAIDWMTRPKNSFLGKPVATAGTTQGALGTACAQQILRAILVYLGAIVLGQPEVYFQFKDGLIDENGNVISDDTRKFLDKFVDRFVAWVEKHR